jgi:DNA-binding LytR/AlgR family response regulator
LFFESADNYVIVYFKKEQRVGKEMVRTSLKAIESEFSSYNCIRCHRSFIVNMQNVSSIKKDGRSYEIAIQGTLLVIPISRSYVKAIKEILAT